MAPATKPPSDTILHVFNDDFFKHKHCPMRTGNVRCRNKSTCDRVDFGCQAGPQHAVKLRDQLMRQIDLLAQQEPTSASPALSGIQTKVEMLIDWVLCQKHTMQRDTAISMTMSFLKQDCGIFVEDRQSVQSQRQRPVDEYKFAAMPSTAECSPYYSAATHLATPPMTSSTNPQKRFDQQPFVFTAGVPVKKSFPAGRPLDMPQHDPFVFPLGDHDKHNFIKTEPGTGIHAAPPRGFTNSSQERHIAKVSAVAKPNKPQPAPFGFNVRTPPSKQSVTEPKPDPVPFGFNVRIPSSKEKGTDPKSAQLPQEKPTKVAQPSLNAHADKKAAPKLQATVPEIPFGFQVRERSKPEASIRPRTPPKTSVSTPAPHDKRNEISAKARQHTLKGTPRSQIDEMVDNLEAMQLSHKKVEKEKQRFEARWRRAEDRVGELEDETEDLKSEQSELKEKVEQLEKEMAALWKVVGARQ